MASYSPYQVRKAGVQLLRLADGSAELRQHPAAEEVTAFRERLWHNAASSQNENVEDVIDDLQLGGLDILQRIERRSAGRIQGDYLPVDHRLIGQCAERPY